MRICNALSGPNTLSGNKLIRLTGLRVPTVEIYRILRLVRVYFLVSGVDSDIILNIGARRCPADKTISLFLRHIRSLGILPLEYSVRSQHCETVFIHKGNCQLGVLQIVSLITGLNDHIAANALIVGNPSHKGISFKYRNLIRGRNCIFTCYYCLNIQSPYIIHRIIRIDRHKCNFKLMDDLLIADIDISMIVGKNARCAVLLTVKLYCLIFLSVDSVSFIGCASGTVFVSIESIYINITDTAGNLHGADCTVLKRIFLNLLTSFRQIHGKHLAVSHMGTRKGIFGNRGNGGIP